MMRKNAFTLAEVLITLGIIGVVAAMTIPTLISNTNGAQFKTAYKKALSTLNQAVLMNIALEDTDFSTLDADASGEGTTAKSMGALLKERMQSATEISDSYTTTVSLNEGTGTTDNPASTPKLSYVAGTCDGNTTNPSGLQGGTCTNGEYIMTVAMDSVPANYVKFAFADGTSFWYHKDSHDCTDGDSAQNNCYGFIDVNGSTGPNTVISCDDAENGVCDTSEITDIYPVIFHGQTVEPATDSARAVLFGK